MTAMPTRALLAAVALTAASLTGCNPAGKLLGKWEADMSHFQAQVEKSGNPMAGALASMMSLVKVEAEFKSDGTCTIGGSMLGQTNSTGAKWRYVKSEGNVVVLMLKHDQGTDEKELRVEFVDNDHFKMVPPSGTGGGESLPFKRVTN